MHFEAKQVVVVGGSARMGRQAALDVVDHGLHAHTHNLAIELAQHKIRVNAVAPLAVSSTSMLASLDFERTPIPLGLYALPRDRHDRIVLTVWLGRHVVAPHGMWVGCDGEGPE